MHTKFYLIPSYDVENLMDSKKIGINSDLSSFEKNRAVLENKQLSDTNALALFDRNNKLNINTKKTIANKINRPETKQVETQTSSMSKEDTSPAQTLNKASFHDQFFKNDSIFDDESQSSFESAPEQYGSTESMDEPAITFNSIIQKAERVIKSSVPRGYESKGMSVYKLLLEKNIPFDGELNIVRDGTKVSLAKLMRAIFFSEAHVNNYKHFFKPIAKLIPDEYIRNRKFLALKMEGSPRAETQMRGSGIAKLKKLKWLVY